MRECSSRNTVQFLNEIDRNHEFQLRKLLGNLRKDSIDEYLASLSIILKKNTCTTIYVIYLYILYLA